MTDSNAALTAELSQARDLIGLLQSDGERINNEVRALIVERFGVPFTERGSLADFVRESLTALPQNETIAGRMATAASSSALAADGSAKAADGAAKAAGTSMGACAQAKLDAQQAAAQAHLDADDARAARAAAVTGATQAASAKADAETARSGAQSAADAAAAERSKAQTASAAAKADAEAVVPYRNQAVAAASEANASKVAAIQAQEAVALERSSAVQAKTTAAAAADTATAAAQAAAKTAADLAALLAALGRPLDYVAGAAITAIGTPIACEDTSGATRGYPANGGLLSTRTNVLGLASAVVAVNAPGTIVTNDTVPVADGVWDAVPAQTQAGKPVYLGTAAGKLSMTKPVGIGLYRARVGFLMQGGSNATRVRVLLGEGALL